MRVVAVVQTRTFGDNGRMKSTTNPEKHMTIIALMENAGIDLRNLSVSRAVQSFTSKQLDLTNTNKFIKTLAPNAPVVEDLETAHYVASHLIQDTLVSGRTVVYPDAIAEILSKAAHTKSISYNGAMYGTETVNSVDEEGNIVRVQQDKTSKRSKGAGSAQAKAQIMFTDNPTLSRSEMIAMMVTELQISANTGSTYYAAFNKDAKRATGGKKGKRAAGGSRDEQVLAVFNSKPTWADRKELVAAIVEQTGATPASANTFSYKVMPSGRAPKAKKVAVKKSAATILGDIGTKNKKAAK